LGDSTRQGEFDRNEKSEATISILAALFVLISACLTQKYLRGWDRLPRDMAGTNSTHCLSHSSRDRVLILGKHKAARLAWSDDHLIVALAPVIALQFVWLGWS